MAEFEGLEEGVIKYGELVWNKKHTLGQGSFGKVYKGEYGGMEVAIKVIVDQEKFAAELKDIEDSSKERDESGQAGGDSRKLDHYSGTMVHLREIRTLARLRHPAILPFYGYSRKAVADPPVIVTQYARGGSLFSGLSRLAAARVKLSEAALLQILRSVAKGLEYLHSRGFIHGDLKPDNILLSDKFDVEKGKGVLKPGVHVMLADFGYSRRFVSHSESKPNSGVWVGTRTVAGRDEVRGTKWYRAPETFDGTWKQESLFAVDVYAFGMIVYELIMGHMPWATEHFLDFQKELVAGRRPDWGIRKIPERYKILAEQCWHPDPLKRPDCKSIIERIKEIVPPEKEEEKIIWPAEGPIDKNYWEIGAIPRPAGLRKSAPYYAPGDSINDNLAHLYSSFNQEKKDPKVNTVPPEPEEEEGFHVPGVYGELTGVISGDTDRRTTNPGRPGGTDEMEGIQR